MNIEKEFVVEKEQPQGTPPESLLFKKIERTNSVAYIFNNVAISLDTSGKNYKKLPEILFGTFDEGETPSGKSMHKPKRKERKITVTMEDVAACLNEVVKDSGQHNFWVYPFGGDSPNPQKREEARLALFKKYFDLVPDEDNHGYILSL